VSGISLPGDADQPTRDVWFGPYCLKPARRQLAVGDRPLPLGGRALDLLIALVERAGEVVSRRELMARVWPDVIVEEANLRVHLSALRKALGDGTGGARYITNVPGRGYSFVAPVQRSAPARGPTKAEPAPLPGRGLPPRLERMVGRDQAVTELCELLRSTRFVSIVASGGMGKTTVAIAAAHALAPEFSNDCCFVDLAAVGEGALVPVTVASALGCYGQGENPLPGLLAFLAGRRLLLILDNCEHVIDAIAPLAENVFKNADQVHLLTTSREALRVDGENVHLLAPLEFPEDDKDLRASTALSSPAIQLFMERAAASGHRLTVDDADARTVAQICRRLDGIALAIELAAGRVGSHGIAGTADLLDNRFKLLWHGRRSALPRHQTLEAMLDWSYNLLAEFERSVLRRLSVFVGVFSLDDALAVVADNPGNEAQVADAIESLVDKSLLSTSSAGGTAYRLLDTTRAYGAGKLRALGEQDAFARRHAQHYANLLGQEGVRATAFGTHRVAAYAPMMGNIRAGLAWSFSVSGDQAIGISLAASAAPLLLGLSLLSECERWCDLAIKLLPASGRDSPRELDLLVPLAISSMFTRGNTEAVRAGIERGLALADSLCDRQHQMDLLAGLNIFLTRIADFAGAVRSAERSALVAAEAGDPAAEIMAEWMVGVSHHLAGNQTKAQHHCERGFELASSLGELDIDFFGYDHRVRALVALARALWLRGMPRRALQAAQQALDEAGRRDHPVNVCIALIYTTPVFLWLGDFDRAEQCIERLLVHSEKHSLRPYNAVGTALKGELLTLQGDAHTGVRLLRSALATLQAERHHILATVFARALAEGLARLGEFDEALSIINKAVERADPSATFDLPDLLRARGEILLAASPENRSAAEASLVRALEIGQAQSAVGWQLRAAVPLARLWLDDDTPERGRALLTELVEQFNKERDTPDVVEARNVLESLQT
jgi:predicted ATPase/DNA-binding winged helix-turn-helix (wHTH) protein